MQAVLHIEGYYQGQGGTVLPGEEDCPAYPETLSFALNGKLQSLRFGVHFCHVSADQMPDGDIRFTCSKFSEMAFAKSGFLSMDGIVSCGVKASGLNFEARDNIEVKGLKELSFLLDFFLPKSALKPKNFFPWYRCHSSFPVALDGPFLDVKSIVMVSPAKSFAISSSVNVWSDHEPLTFTSCPLKTPRT